MTVIDLAARRDQHRRSEPGRCRCGSEWFTLHGRATDPAVAGHGAVTISSEGSITGYCGEVRCAECREPWAPCTDMPRT